MLAWPLFFVAGLELWAAIHLPIWAGWLLAWAGLSTAYVGVAYLVRRPEWLFKGRPWRVLLAPYLAFSRAVAWSAQRIGLIERQEVVPGLWVGGWPRQGAPGFSQLDLTSELPRRGDAEDYCNIPMLDGAAPRQEAYEAAVRQALAWRAEGRMVLVHCAYGHGRSVSVVLGVLLSEGHAATPAEAMELVTRVRPRARMSPEQRRFVERHLGTFRA